MRAPFRNSLFAAACLVSAAAFSGGAQAGIASPAIGQAAPQGPALTENVRWACGIWRCVWRPNWRLWPVAPYARAWGPPPAPECVWRRGPRPDGSWGWNQICP